MPYVFKRVFYKNMALILLIFDIVYNEILRSNLVLNIHQNFSLVKNTRLIQ